MYICESHASHNQSALCLMCSGRPHATGSSTRYTASLPSPNRLNSEPQFGFAQLLMSGLSDIESPASDVTKASHCDPHHSGMSRRCPVLCHVVPQSYPEPGFQTISGGRWTGRDVVADC